MTHFTLRVWSINIKMSILNKDDGSGDYYRYNTRLKGNIFADPPPEGATHVVWRKRNENTQ